MRNKKNKFVKKHPKFEKFLWFLCGFLMCVALIIGSYDYLLITKQIDDYASNQVYYSPGKYVEDSSVIEVANKCNDSLIKSECVFDEIPFTYVNRSSSGIIEPNELYENGEGMCRDIAVFRMAVLTKLNITASYVIPKGENHIFVISYENGDVYEFNNEYLVEYATTGISKKAE